MSEAQLVLDGRVIADGVDTLIVAGWTGRDAEAVEHHVRELAALGVAPPSTVPLFYRTSAALLGTRAMIEVLGESTSGEAEPMLVLAGGRRWLGVASDHTDRALEAHSVAHSKQICAKPCARELWPLDDVVERLDELELRAWISDDPDPSKSMLVDDTADWTLYQEGTLAALRPLVELLEASPLAAYYTDTALETGPVGAMLCGTLPAIGGVRAAGAFRFELVDPASGRKLRHAYRVRVLPVID